VSVDEPPNIDEVLQPGEEVEWAGKERTSFNYACFIGLALFVIPIIVMSPIPLFSPIALLSYLYGIIVFSVTIRNVFLYPKWYRITNRRLLEMRGKRIGKEVELSRFGDIPLRECVAVRLDHHASERGSSPVNDIIFFNPETSKPLIMFNDIWYMYTLDLEILYDRQKCSSCDIEVNSKLKKCLACGQSLV